VSGARSTNHTAADTARTEQRYDAVLAHEGDDGGDVVVASDQPRVENGQVVAHAVAR
jgi:hypothetical protein